MTLQRMIVRAEIGDDEGDAPDPRAVTVTCNTEMKGRDGLILVSSGCILDNYRLNPVWLWQHDPDRPIARADAIQVRGSKLVARVVFPPEGVSADADEKLGLIRAKVINAASTGFEIRESERIDPDKHDSGTRVTSWELMEMSFVSIPAVPDALISSRANTEKEIGAMVERALQQREQLENDEQLRAAVKGAIIRRGMYGVGQFAYLLEELGYLKSSAEWEAEYEGDNSPVPAKLAAALKFLGETLIEMTQEEVAEMIGGEDVEIAGADVSEGILVEASATPAVKRFQIGYRRARADMARRRAVKPLAFQVDGVDPKAKTERTMEKHRLTARLFEAELAGPQA